MSKQTNEFLGQDSPRTDWSWNPQLHSQHQRNMFGGQFAH